SRMYVQKTLWDTHNATSSQGSAAGRMPSGSPDGPTTGPYGPDPALASLTPRQALEKGMTTRGPYGGHGGGSSTSVDLQLSLASRLRQKLDVNGSPEYGLTWKQWDMPSGPPICALRASARRTLGSGYGGWRTPSGSDGEGGEMDILLAQREGYQPKLKLRDQAKLAGWPTPIEDDASNVTRQSGAFQSLARTAQIAGWLTPRADESASDRKQSGKPNLQGLARMASGTMQSGSPAPTERRGALNPALSLWLMGFPEEWLSCGVRAMQSSRRSRRRS